jgi:hypothetical protein
MITRDHYQNRERFPQEELAKYYGKHVAWNADGTQIVASGNDDGEVIAIADAAGYKRDEVIFSYVPFPNEVFWGGAFTVDEGAKD